MLLETHRKVCFLFNRKKAQSKCSPWILLNVELKWNGKIKSAWLKICSITSKTDGRRMCSVGWWRCELNKCYHFICILSWNPHSASIVVKTLVDDIVWQQRSQPDNHEGYDSRGIRIQVNPVGRFIIYILWDANWFNVAPHCIFILALFTLVSIHKFFNYCFVNYVSSTRGIESRSH